MAYKMKTKASSGGKGKRGLGKVILSTDGTKVKVIFKDEPDLPVILDRENCPDLCSERKMVCYYEFSRRYDVWDVPRQRHV